MWLSGGRYKDSNKERQSKRFYIAGWVKKEVSNKVMLVTATTAYFYIRRTLFF